MSTAPGASVRVDLDLERQGEPIEPYIFGQFIEHLGRCIYGGIWAEKLEDRKFYFPITAAYDPYRGLEDTEFPVIGASPWEIVGDGGAVTMSTEHVFVGEHSPRLGEGTAIRQHRIGLREGLAYEGRLWVLPLDGEAEVEVSLEWGDGAGEQARERFRLSGDAYLLREFRLRAGAATDDARFVIRALRGAVQLGPPSLMPEDHVNGLRRDTLALLKQLDSPMYRWPGGNFVSGYNWRDGIGDRDRRPPRKNPAWTGVEHNDFGTDEFIAFCREVGAEPMIAANTGLGDAQSAAAWVAYCNRPADTEQGAKRALNGSPEPFGVKYWCVGNEMFGTWQLGWMQLRHYVIKHNEVARAMWDVDPGLDLVAVGDLLGINEDHDPEQAASGKTWSEGMLEACADYMTHISEHFYRGRVEWADPEPAPILEYVQYLKESIRERAEGHRVLQARLDNLAGRRIPIALDEWNYWHGEDEYEYGELGCVYDLRDGLGVAMGLHEFFRQSDIIKMAHYAQTVNVIGAIKTSRTAAEMESTGLALQLYREHFESIPLLVPDRYAPLDVMAAVNPEGTRLTLGVVNPTDAVVSLEPAVAAGQALPGTTVRRIHLTGPDARAHNTPGQPRVVDVHTGRPQAVTQVLEVPALSAAVFVFE